MRDLDPAAALRPGADFKGRFASLAEGQFCDAAPGARCVRALEEVHYLHTGVDR